MHHDYVSSATFRVYDIQVTCRLSGYPLWSCSDKVETRRGVSRGMISPSAKRMRLHKLVKS